MQNAIPDRSESLSPSKQCEPEGHIALSAVSLDRLLSQVRNAKGIPPKAISSLGVACIHPYMFQENNYKVMDMALLQSTENHQFTVVSLWPLEVVDEGFVALDESSTASLGLSFENVSIYMPSLQSPRRNYKNKKGKRRTPSKAYQDRRGKCSDVLQAMNGKEENDGRAQPNNSVGIKLLKAFPRNTLEEASVIRLSCHLDLEFLAAEECTTMLHAGLLGRALKPDVQFKLSLFGEGVCFKVASVIINSRKSFGIQNNEHVCLCTKATLIEVVPSNLNPGSQEEDMSSGLKTLGGLDWQIERLREITEAAFRGNYGDTFPEISSSFSKRPQGILIHGVSGTGKTKLVCALAHEYGLNLEIVSGPELVGKYTSESLRTLENTFLKARRRSPSLVLLDEVDAIAPRRDLPAIDEAQRKITAALLAILDGHDGSELENVLVIGTTSRPDLIDPAMRRPGRFDHEIEITISNANGRFQILKNLVKQADSEKRLKVAPEGLEKIATICYGFVGADLVALWREAVCTALLREPTASVTEVDFREALKKVRPSALREVAVEIPSTFWSDIGGKEEAKQRLREAVEWPLTEKGSSLFSSVGVTPPRGILLYGPPGCSKTLLARAVATESRANFISVKGAELLSKWVGESEKAVRSIFRRARQAAPCVIFFDEIDALAMSRSSLVGASAQARVVAQLLSEMDGIDTDESNRVVVIAATNRPDCLDSAFLRPGRIDVQIYVGLPDSVERLSILEVHTRKVPIADDVDRRQLAHSTQGYSGAELAAVVREAALSAMERDVCNASVVSALDFSEALRKVLPRTPSAVLDYFESYNKELETKMLSALPFPSIPSSVS